MSVTDSAEPGGVVVEVRNPPFRTLRQFDAAGDDGAWLRPSSGRGVGWLEQIAWSEMVAPDLNATRMPGCTTVNSDRTDHRGGKNVMTRAEGRGKRWRHHGDRAIPDGHKCEILAPRLDGATTAEAPEGVKKNA